MARIAVIEKEKCNPLGCGNYLCIRLCPVNRTGKECIIVGENKKPLINEELCTGCGICPNRCPFEAISIINLPKELDKQPIHQYGENGFHLYNLPIPIFGKVVGILGVNGIGKSTAIKILAGVLKPNLGNIKETSFDVNKLIAFFKGTEAQIFFEKVKKNEIKVAYKPQQVDLIPQTTKGKIRDLLKNIDNEAKIEELSNQLDIFEILDHNINEISGGELQRVAIAATVLKKADLYIFDELTSYLDIKQRLKVSKFIRGLANENTAVMVIEHDLIALDYMTDLVHIMYGKQGAYGVVSLPKTTKAGINSYLEGYLKEENIRFRDHQIKFEIKPPEKEKKSEILISWEKIFKKLGSFELGSEKGDIRKHEVIGVLGENGIGKTTFIKILANVLNQDKGNITDNIKVSYKPQYIPVSDELVMSILHDAIKKHNNDVIEPLNLKPLFLKKVNELSGGELQRVAIAEALSKDCDLILLDEPSAYLDVEQRLKVSRIITNLVNLKGKPALVVDHDLLFLDYLSTRLLVFEGIPSKKGAAKGPFSMEHGMNCLLKEVGITLRREELSGRPRINKLNSRKDQEQKRNGNYYYT